MKKLTIKLVLMVAIMIGVSNYMMYVTTGKSPLSFSLPDFSMPDAAGALSNIGDNVIPARSETAYKWTDEHGTVHYSNEAPLNMDSEKLTVDPNTNLVRGMTPKPEPTPSTQEPSQPDMPKGNIYNPDTVKRLMDDAKNVQKTLNERYENLEDY